MSSPPSAGVLLNGAARGPRGADVHGASTAGRAVFYALGCTVTWAPGPPVIVGVRKT